MRTWTHNPNEQAICGGPCRQLMRKGDPLLEIHIEGMKSVMRRCAACAGEAVPADLPALAEAKLIVPTAMIHIHQDANALRLDYKTAAAGREPGEDG